MTSEQAPDRGKIEEGSSASTDIPYRHNRRDFLRMVGIGAGSLAFGGWLIRRVDAQGRPTYSMIVVDFNKCTGCRTCETICAQNNHRINIDGQELWGLGNPALSNVRVAYFNPPVDIPNRCVMCEDAPCIAACPVEPHPESGHRALYRDEKTQAIKNDPERCIACGSCASACREKRVGAILLDSDSGKPTGICNLCEGDPVCVKYCPYGALTHIKGGLKGQHYALPPEEIARQLTALWYQQR